MVAVGNLGIETVGPNLNQYLEGALGVAVSEGASPCWDGALGGCARRVRAMLGDEGHGRLGVTHIGMEGFG